MEYNFATALSDAARLSPNKAFVVTADGARHTFAQVRDRAAAAASVLAAKGVGTGDRVALRLPNTVEFISYYFGLLSLGAVVLPLNPAASAREVAYVAQDADLTGMIVPAGDALLAEPPATLWPIDSLVAEEPAGPVPFAPVSLDGETTALVLYTSGSTGEPKGVELSHMTLLLVPINENLTTPAYEDDVYFAVLPLYHVYGLSDLLNGPVLRRNTIVLRERFSTADALDAIQRERVTSLCGVPTMLHALTSADLSGRDLSSVRTVASGGAPLSPTQIERVRSTFPNADFVEGYGLTETAAAGTYNGHPFAFRHGSVGQALAGMQVAIFGPDDQVLPPGEENVGEIVMKGSAIMKGYYRRPEKTAEALRDGWLRTGDLGWLDDEGYLYIVGRSKELIIRGGFNVYPPEVEHVLETHPSVAQAAVVGRPDEHYGEEVVAFIVVAEGVAVPPIDEIVEFCAAQLAPYKYPREVHALAALPLGPTGKIDKLTLSRIARGADENT